MAAVHDQALRFASNIELELKRLGAWQSSPPPREAFLSDEPFFSDTLAFTQWIQFVLLDRIRSIAQQEGSFPSRSQVGVRAVREFDGWRQASRLTDLLSAFDAFIEQPSERLGIELEEVLPEPEPEPIPPAPPPEPVLPPQEVVHTYWHTRDPRWLHSSPSSKPGFDTQLVERIFGEVQSLREVLGEGPPAAGGLAFRTLVDSFRGSWVILTVVRPDDGHWRVDLPASLGATAFLYLRMHQHHPPGSELAGPLGRAIEFWSLLQKQDRSAAALLAVPSGADLPDNAGSGALHEFLWPLSCQEQGDHAVVRMLANLDTGSGIRETRLRRIDGDWRIDLGPAS